MRHTINNFNIVPDMAAVARIGESISTLQQARELRMREAETSLKSRSQASFLLSGWGVRITADDPGLSQELARQLGTLAAQHDELTAAHSSAAHASEMARLDTHKFRIAKAAADLEMETDRLASRAADMAARLQELALRGLDGSPSPAPGAAPGRASVEDEVLLRLKVYRSLGIELERDEKDGEWTRAVIRNDRKGDVHVVNMDKKFSSFFYANYFWQTV